MLFDQLCLPNTVASQSHIDEIVFKSSETIGMGGGHTHVVFIIVDNAPADGK